ncbi:hypothetical protein L1987_56682 [Smallanthus sonchifolius]|uniref:Uncharacterized protein n=1 Tax=Smallanthus sonchifolius TaxID=185202 RepID=A0ACB9ED46_9ASTR|nr:hypothetical protein L1987_56682 [Smallanthus sonchifolius]
MNTEILHLVDSAIMGQLESMESMKNFGDGIDADSIADMLVDTLLTTMGGVKSFEEEDDDNSIPTVMKNTQAAIISGHSVSVADLNTWLRLVKRTIKTPWGPRLMVSLEKALSGKESRAPHASLGPGEGPESKSSLAAVSANQGKDEGTRNTQCIFSFISSDNQGIKACFHAQFLVVESGGGKGPKVPVYFTHAFKAQCWYFIALENTLKEPIGPDMIGRLAVKGPDSIPSFGNAAGLMWLSTDAHVASIEEGGARLNADIAGYLHLLYHPSLLTGHHCPDASPSGPSGLLQRSAEVLGHIPVTTRMRPAEALWALAYGGPMSLLPFVVSKVDNDTLEPKKGNLKSCLATIALTAPIFRIISLAIQHLGNNNELCRTRAPEVLSKILTYLLKTLSSLDVAQHAVADEEIAAAVVSLCQSQKNNLTLKIQLFSTLLLDLKIWSLCSYGIQKKLLSSLADLVFTESFVMCDAKAIQALLDGCRRSPPPMAVNDIRCLLGFLVDCPQPNQKHFVILQREAKDGDLDVPEYDDDILSVSGSRHECGPESYNTDDVGSLNRSEFSSYDLHNRNSYISGMASSIGSKVSASESLFVKNLGGISFSISAENARNTVYNIDKSDGIVVAIIGLFGALVISGHLKSGSHALADLTGNRHGLLDGAGSMFDDKVSLLHFAVQKTLQAAPNRLMTGNVYTALLSASALVLNASARDEELNFYDPQHRFEHLELLLVLLHSLPYSTKSFQTRALQDLLILACSHSENRSSLTKMEEWPQWLLEILISNHEMSVTNASTSSSIKDVEDLIHNFLVIMLEHSMREKDRWKVLASITDDKGEISASTMEHLTAAAAAAEPYDSVSCAFVSYGSCVIDLAQGWKYRSRLWYVVGQPSNTVDFGGGGSGWDSWKSCLEKDSNGNWVEIPLIKKCVSMLHALLLDESGFSGGSGTGFDGLTALYPLLDSDQSFFCMLRMTLVSLREDDDGENGMIMKNNVTVDDVLSERLHGSATSSLKSSNRTLTGSPVQHCYGGMACYGANLLSVKDPALDAESTPIESALAMITPGWAAAFASPPAAMALAMIAAGAAGGAPTPVVNMHLKRDSSTLLKRKSTKFHAFSNFQEEPSKKSAAVLKNKATARVAALAAARDLERNSKMGTERGSSAVAMATSARRRSNSDMERVMRWNVSEVMGMLGWNAYNRLIDVLELILLLGFVYLELDKENSILALKSVSTELTNEDDERNSVTNMEINTDEMWLYEDIHTRPSATSEQQLQVPKDSTEPQVSNYQDLAQSPSAAGPGYIPSEHCEIIIVELRASMVRPLKVRYGKFQVTFEFTI